jgi:protein-L-isoaspartate(D-aspartate) O-methyltransferase
MDPQEHMIRMQVEARGVRTPAVLEAMRRVPREWFVPEYLREDAYEDRPLEIGLGQTISQPYMVAVMTEAVLPAGARSILEIGTGSGYQTAILARLIPQVYTVERLPELLHRAQQTLGALGIRNVEYRVGDGTLGWKEHAPFDRILIAAAAPEIPRRLLIDQLAEGGIALVPAAAGAMGDWQNLYRVRRMRGELQVEDLGGCRFVPLVGEEGYPGGDGA